MSIVSMDAGLESRIIAQAKKDKKNFSPLYEHYKEHIKKFFLAKLGPDEDLAEELTAITFEKALKSLDNFQWQGISFSAWIYRIASNTLVDHFRQNDKRRLTQQLDPEKSYDAKIDIEEEFIEDEESRNLHKLLNELPTREREIVYMKFFDGYTNKLIARLTGLSETNISTIVYRAIGKLRLMYVSK